jgi:NitT/TauT family transport system permease protein/taurine transport system permease protein
MSGIEAARPSREDVRAPVIGPKALRLICLAAILAAWEFLPRLGLVPPVMLASLSATLKAGLDNYPAFANALAVTFSELLSALIIAYGAGAVLGIVLGSLRPLRLTLLPLASSAYAVPLVIVYPVLTAWVGIGPESKVIFGGLYGFFPMLLATAAGVQTVDPQFVLAARSMGASTRQLLLQVMLPAALPSGVSGLRRG